MESATTSQPHLEIHVKSLVTGEKANFAMSPDATIQATWDQSYVQLEESRRDGDTFRCADGTDLTSKLNVTLEQLREEHVCAGEQFEIRGRSGGA